MELNIRKDLFRCGKTYEMLKPCVVPTLTCAVKKGDTYYGIWEGTIY